MGEAALKLAPLPKRRKPKEEWAKNFTDAEVRRALERHELTAREQMQLERLCSLSLQEGYAFIGQVELARLLRCSVRTLNAVTKRLCTRGMLETTLLRDGLRYRPLWEAIGLEGPDSERERSGQRSANPADPDRQILPMHPYGSRIGSRNSEKNSSRATPAPHRTNAPSAEETAAALSPSALQREMSRSVLQPPRAPSQLQSNRHPSPDASSASSARQSAATATSPDAPPLAERLLSAEEAEAADRELEACRDTLAAEIAARAETMSPAPRDVPALSLVAETPDEDDEGPSSEITITVPPVVLLGRVPPPTVAVVAAPDQLAQVLERFGPEAHADSVEVLRSWPARQNPEAAMDALTRLLEMDPGDIQKSAGACLRSYLRLACRGQLRLAKTHPRGGTTLHRLERQRDAAAQRGDFDAANATKEKMVALAQRAKEQVAALRQLAPSPDFAVHALTPATHDNVRRLPERAAREAPRMLPRSTTPSREQIANAIRAQLMLRYLTPGQRHKLERELAEVEGTFPALPAPESTPATTEEPHAQQGQQARP